MSLIILWNNGVDNRLKGRLRAVGRMALTNYLTQTVLGVLVLTILVGRCRIREPGCHPGVRASRCGRCSCGGRRRGWAVFVFGPAEWLWRVATYRTRSAASPSAVQSRGAA